MATDCYFADGTLDLGGFPCDTMAVKRGKASSCCRKNSVCYADGTCAPSAIEASYQRSCTDDKWESSACPHRCLAPPNGTEIPIEKCPTKKGKACCNRASQGDCCYGTGFFFEYRPGEVTHRIVNGTSTARERASEGSTPPKAWVERPGLPWYRDTTVIGLLAGIGAASALLLGIIVVIWRRRRGLRDRSTSSTTGTPSTVGAEGKKRKRKRMEALRGRSCQSPTKPARGPVG